jgi:hypothetical protein
MVPGIEYWKYYSTAMRKAVVFVKAVWAMRKTINEHQNPQKTHRSRAAARRHQRRLCARKSIRHGHPSTLHLWWARRPLAAARAVIFAQMVNDPGYQQGGGFKYGVNKEKAAIERERLFKIIEDLVLWENTNNEEVLARARAEIREAGGRPAN